MNVLCLDDDDDYALIMSHAFKAQRTVSRAPTMAEALPIMERITMDLILLDLTLPDSSPEETIARIGDIKERSPRAKVIVLTCNPRDDIRRRAYSAGADLVLQKDPDFHKTVGAIMQLFRSQKRGKPDECADMEYVNRIEATIRTIAASELRSASIPGHVAREVVAILAGRDAWNMHLQRRMG